MNWLFQSKPNGLFVLIHWYSTLFNSLRWIMLNYSCWFALFCFLLRFQSPPFLFVLIFLGCRIYRLDLIMNQIPKSAICPSLIKWLCPQLFTSVKSTKKNGESRPCGINETFWIVFNKIFNWENIYQILPKDAIKCNIVVIT